MLAIAQMQLIDEVFQTLTLLEELGVFLVMADYDVSGLLIPVPEINLLRQCFQVFDEKVEILQKSFFNIYTFHLKISLTFATVASIMLIETPLMMTRFAVGCFKALLNTFTLKYSAEEYKMFCSGTISNSSWPLIYRGS